MNATIDNSAWASVDGRLFRATPCGRIFVEGGKEVAATDNGLGYMRVRLGKKRYMVHLLVWRAFKGNVPAGMQVDHIDGNKANNCIENLRILTPSQNTIAYHSRIKGSGLPHIKNRSPRVGAGVARLVRLAAKAGVGTLMISKSLGVTRSCIRHILSGRNYGNA